MSKRSFHILLLFFLLAAVRPLYAQHRDAPVGDPLSVLQAAPVSPPPVNVVRFLVFGRDDTTALRAGSATLEYEQHSVAFEFLAAGPAGWNAVRYRYMLEGLDSGWSAPTERRYANYTHLPPGEYRFQVAARTGSGPWSRTPASFPFTIGAPFWARWWFICSVTAALLFVLYGLYRLRLAHMLEIERVRNRIAADLHDDIGSTLSSIAVFSRLAEQETAATLPAVAGIMHRIGMSSQAVLESLDDIIWMVKPGNDSLDTIMLRIREYATHVCEAGDIALAFSTPPTLGHLRMSLEDRRQLYLIAKEAINNIIKHARCSHALVNLTVHGRELTLTITDDGQGFTSAAEPCGDGLDNMQRRARSMGGHLVIESVPREGTTVVLRSRTT